MTVAEVERIGAPEIPRVEARRAFLEYKKAVLGEKDEQRRKEYDGLMRGYGAIAKGQQVIDLHKTMLAAGLQDATHYPKLAVCRAHAARCFVRMEPNGGCVFGADRRPSARPSSAKYFVSMPSGTFQAFVPVWRGPAASTRPPGWSEDASALVPIVPPHLHPARHLRNYHTLWDAVWTKEPPTDPMLLKHLAGHLYAIVAAWDLTPLEQAVMRGRL